MSDVSNFIRSVQKSNLFAECPRCGEEFPISHAMLFDGRKEFPDTAEKKRLELQQELEKRLTDLKKLQLRADIGAERGAIASGYGKIMEKILPASKNFNMPLNDCRFLGEPIDLIIFKGSTEMKINHITFMEIKTGKEKRLNPREKLVRDVIEDHKVKCKVF